MEKPRDITPDDKAKCMIPRQIFDCQVCHKQFGELPPNHDLVERAMIEGLRRSSLGHGTMLDRPMDLGYWVIFVRETRRASP